MVDRPTGPIAPWMAERMRLPAGSVLGSADVARLLGVTRQRVSQLKREPTFPRAGMHYGGVGLWHRAGIECWVAAHRPQAEQAAGRFAGDAGRLLLAAEDRARRHRIHWIDTTLFWLCVAEGEAGDPLRVALESMGVTTDEIVKVIEGARPTDDRPRRSLRMNPHLQTLLAGADRSAEAEGRDRIRPLDLLLAFIDAKPIYGSARPQPADHLLAVLSGRGVEIPELRRRLIAADDDPSSIASFEVRKLRPYRRRAMKRPDGLVLAPNPLGHDPWTRMPWGAAFARTRDGRHLKVDGAAWFFIVDGDGFYVRAIDGRPVGYRYRVEPPPRLRRGQRWIKPVNGFHEILPMPPVAMADWPDRRSPVDD